MAAAAGASFGTVAIFAKLAFDDGADPLPVLAVRFGLTSAFLVAFHLATRRSLALPRSVALRLLALGALGYAFEASLFFYALEFAPAGVVTLIFYSYPLWTTVFSIATRLERFDLRVAIALLLGTAGVAMIFSLDGGDARGPLLACAAAIAVAVYFLFAQIITKGVAPVASATWTSLGAAIALGTVLPFVDWSFPAEAFAPTFGLAVATTFAFVVLYAAIARVGSARVAIASMFEPVTTVALAAIFLEEDITIRIAIGAVLVIAALPILVTSSKKADGAMAPDTV